MRAHREGPSTTTRPEPSLPDLEDCEPETLESGLGIEGPLFAIITNLYCINTACYGICTTHLDHEPRSAVSVPVPTSRTISPDESDPTIWDIAEVLGMIPMSQLGPRHPQV